ncbi:MAG: indolepyruvate oxidoreductase subunit beta [Desulfobacula sp.]|jgi:indolepyruvate ferredoxin oxidoreductase, beta subunit|uniref:indolepyruvate oxidoreductase subunit beta n=1 Tax=Desulfobacula sp. TaxID=2593537 RepID=UPI001D30D983|nr:indolepyruvate oxidoreductase subunit beta [Desulfobacula sp.]MBT3485066.1 indolepyruvate oxidoreductase subunit beta [Desulfobacula sp.]MBT3804630.1 indolepyruvate oxidoreductase subunit beta [Desulfobacula sp.]MBT4025077.1 indolepyruvate oxidoreductase subunit beta [Desulfobacula sp.]MBT4198230.1 indolepyruvate oxidoreductase subunit beta [Desulfobacula sp.]
METTRLIMVAVGGQGNLLASKVLGEAALISGVQVRMSEIHGMAQRGGVVESAIVFGEATSSIISDGEADILLGFEPSETLRALNRCSKDTKVITNTATLPPFTVSIGKGVYPDVENIKELLKDKCASLVAIDAMALAKEAGSPMSVNIVLLGALIESGSLGFTKENVIEAIKRRTKKAFLEKNLNAFELGFVAAQNYS